MKTLFSDKQAKEMDKNSTQDFLIPEVVLMEDAALSTYNLISNDIKNAKDVLFISGPGNNGADALAIARLAYLDGNTNIKILLVDENKESTLRKLQRSICEKLGIKFSTSFDDASLIIDGLFGVGLKGSIRSYYIDVINKINDSGALIISLDVPSGFSDYSDCTNCICAHVTICMGELKKSLYHPKYRDNAGDIKTTALSFFPKNSKKDSNTYLLDFNDLVIPTLKPSSYKKTRGSIAIIGGSSHYTGAVILAAKAAFHTGSGLITIYTDASLVSTIAKAIPSAMVDVYENISNLSIYDAVLIGPGMGKNQEEIVKYALENSKNLVVDATALRIMAKYNLTAKGKCILTPHLGEYNALIKAFMTESNISTIEDWEETLIKMQNKLNATIVVKANTVWIRENGKTYVFDGQNPSLGVAGSGDVLSGIAVSLMGLKVSDIAKIAAIVHQKAGFLAHRDLNFYSSNDLINYIGKSF